MLGISLAAVPAGMLTLIPAIASATVIVWVLPSALVNTMLSMSEASTSCRSSLTVTLVALSLRPDCSILNTIASPWPSIAVFGSALRLSTGVALLSKIVPVPVTPSIVRPVVSSLSSMLSAVVG